MTSPPAQFRDFRRTIVRRYLTAVVLTGAMLWLRVILGETVEQATVIEFTIPILLSALLGGTGPGMLATVLSALGAAYFVFAPKASLHISTSGGFWKVAVLLGVGMTISACCGARYRVQRRLEEKLAEISAVRDEQAATMEALHESEEVFEKSFRLSPDCLAIVRMADGAILQANEAAALLWGSPVEEIIGKSTADYIEWEDQADRARFRETLARTGECLFARARLQICGAPARDVELSSRIISFRGESCVLSIMRDISERLRTEDAASELAAIVDSSDDAIIGKDLNGIVRSWNDGARKVFGYTAEEMVGNSIRTIIPPDRVVEEEHLIALVRGGGISRQGDTVRQRKDGKLIDVLITASPIRDDAGNIMGVSTVAREITERKQAEAALVVSESRYRALFEYAPDGILIADWVSQCLDANTSLCQMLGYSTEELAEMQAADLVVSADGAHIGGALAVVDSGDSYHDEWKFRRKDGSAFPADVLARRMPDGNLLIVVRDVSERQQLLSAMAESEDRFRTMANSIPQLAWIAQPDGFITWYNDRWYEYTGLTPEQMGGWEWQTVHDPQILPKTMEGWAVAIAAGNPFELEFPLRGADGQFRAFLTKVRPLKDADGRVVQWIGTNTDIELVKQAEEKVRTLNAELERRVALRTTQLQTANQELEAFSYSVSHDLRSPLRAVDGFSQAVLEDYGDVVPDECRRYLHTIREAAQKMGALIDDLLTFSRLSRLPLNKQKIDTANLVRGVLDDLAMQNPMDEPAELEIRDLPACYGDPGLLRQVWVNLLSNAYKYSRKREKIRIEIGCEDTPDGPAFYVRDNGTGFDMRYADKLFGVFQRLHRAEDFEGTGVGLAIVHRIVHRHGGKTWAQSAPNAGATFYFTLNGKKNS